MTVVEVRGRGAQLIERVRLDQASIRVGRAFDNDVIVEDEFVSPHHLQLTALEEGWRFEDQASANGTRLGRRVVRDGVIRSGAALRIGHSTLHFYEDDHAVAPAQPMDGVQERLADLERPAVWGTLLAMTLAFSVADQFWNSVHEFELQTALSPMLTAALILASVAAVWALIGRVLRHRAHFLAHLSLWLGFSLANRAASFVAQTLAYNFGSARLEETVETTLGIVVLAVAIWGSLALASHLQSQRRFYAAVATACLISSISITGRLQFDPEFSFRPEYYGRVESPLLLWARASDQQRLIEELPALCDRADEAAEEEEL